jgi:hypothetical protein
VSPCERGKVQGIDKYRILKASTDDKRSQTDHVRHGHERDLGNLNRRDPV